MPLPIATPPKHLAHLPCKLDPYPLPSLDITKTHPLTSHPIVELNTPKTSPTLFQPLKTHLGTQSKRLQIPRVKIATGLAFSITTRTHTRKKNLNTTRTPSLPTAQQSAAEQEPTQTERTPRQPQTLLKLNGPRIFIELRPEGVFFVCCVVGPDLDLGTWRRI